MDIVAKAIQRVVSLITTATTGNFFHLLNHVQSKTKNRTVNSLAKEGQGEKTMESKRKEKRSELAAAVIAG